MQPMEKLPEVRSLEPKPRVGDKDVLRDTLREQGERGQTKSDIVLLSVQRLLRRGAITNLAKMLGRMHPADIAKVIVHLSSPKEKREVFELVRGESKRGQVLSELDTDSITQVLSDLLQSDIAWLIKDLAPDDVASVNLAIDELVSNVINYAFDDGKVHQIQLTVTVEGDLLTLSIDDEGKAFNPLEVPMPDLDQPIEQRPVGGLGIFLVKSIADTLAYRREDGHNILTLTRTLSPRPTS